MSTRGFQALLPAHLQSPIITSFLYPYPDFDFCTFYKTVKEQGFVLYPGKISQADTFRIGNIGEVYPSDIKKLLAVINLPVLRAKLDPQGLGTTALQYYKTTIINAVQALLPRQIP
jgi:aspartate aminotransferase-like enzyme